MTTRVATDPSGTTWRVRRRWIPHREGKGLRAHLARRDRRRDWLELPEALDAVDDVASILVALGLALALVLFIAFGPGLILIGVDLVWLFGVFLVGLVARFVFRRPWLVDAESSTGERRQWAVQGFRSAARVRDEIARDLAAGRRPMPD